MTQWNRPLNEPTSRPFRTKFPPILLLVLAAVFPLLLLAACTSDRPEAQLAASPTAGPAPLIVIFTNSSLYTEQFEWDFGEGTTLTTYTLEEPVSHGYTVVGTYEVTLNAVRPRFANPGSDLATVTITVEAGPLARLALDTQKVTLQPGEVHSFSVEAVDRFNNPIPDPAISFRAIEPAGQVDDEGRFTAGTQAGSYPDALVVEVTQGSVTMTATADVMVQPGSLDP